MSDDVRDMLESERRRHTLPEGTVDDVMRRHDRHQRNRRLGSAVAALVIAAAGIGGGLYAFRSVGGEPVASPSASVSVGPGPSPTTPQGEFASPGPAGTIQFLDEQHGWAIFNGRLVSTSDGGKSWGDSGTVGSNEVQAVDFIDLLHGWVLLPNSILGTSDGGATWDLVTHQSFQTLDFVDTQTGWAVGSDSFQPPGALVRTEDGGRTWTSQGVTSDSVCLASTGRAWTSGLSGDGGSISVFRWDRGAGSGVETPLPLPQGEPWTSQIRCTPDGTGAFVQVTGGGAAGHVAYVAFQLTAAPGSNGDDVHPILVATFAAGVVGVDAFHDDDPYPGVFTVVDAGLVQFVTWCPACDGSWASALRAEGQPTVVSDRIPMPTTGNPSAPTGISFVDDQKGWVLFEGRVLATQDGGATWFDPCEVKCGTGLSEPGA